MPTIKEFVLWECLYSERKVVSDANVFALPEIATYPTAMLAQIQVQSGNLRIREDGTPVTTLAGALVTCTDATNPPMVELSSKVSTGNPLASVSLVSPAGACTLWITYFGKVV